MWANGNTTLKAEKLSDSDKRILRQLARKVAEISADPLQQQRAAHCLAHNDLKTDRPIVLCYPEGAWNELLPPQQSVVCESEFARFFENDLRQRIYYAAHLPDDNPIRNELHVPLCGGFTGFGVETHVTKSADSRGAHHYEAVIRSLEDVQKMQPSRVQLDMGESERRTEIMQDLLGDLMDVQQKGLFRSICVPIDDFATLCGLDNIYMDMIDQPEMIHAALGLMVDSWIDGVRELERVGALSLGIHNEYCGAGGVSYTNDLPQKDFDGTHVRLKDLWGFAAAQMFSEVSPDMHEEFAVQHEKKFLALFGLNSYGCCEPLHNKLDMLIRNIPNLRRFSISPWADVEKCAEKLQNKYIYSYKPNPAILASETFNPEAVRRSITEFCEKTKGCITEIVMKDTHTLRNEPHRLSEWVRITKEVVAEFHG